MAVTALLMVDGDVDFNGDGANKDAAVCSG